MGDFFHEMYFFHETNMCQIVENVKSVKKRPHTIMWRI